MTKNTSYIALQMLLLVSFLYVLGPSLRAELSRTHRFSEQATIPFDQEIPGDAEDKDHSNGTEGNEGDSDVMIFEALSLVRLSLLSKPMESERGPLFREYHPEISAPPPKIQSSFS